MYLAQSVHMSGPIGMLAAAQHISIQHYLTVPLWECSRMPTNSVLPIQAAHIRRLNGMLAFEHSPILMPEIILQGS